jgi:hypothetical protein
LTHKNNDLILVDFVWSTNIYLGNGCFFLQNSITIAKINLSQAFYQQARPIPIPCGKGIIHCLKRVVNSIFFVLFERLLDAATWLALHED